MGYRLNTVTDSTSVPLGYPMLAASSMLKGAAAMIVTTGGTHGLAQNLAAGTSRAFIGFAEDGADNLTGAAGAKYVRIIPSGMKKIATGGIATASDDYSDALSPVYMSDEKTYTLASASNEVMVGQIYVFSPEDGGHYINFRAFISSNNI